MKITVFTSNNLRHNFLIKSLLKVCTELHVIQENKTIFPNLVTGQYKTSSTSKKYFNNVNKAQQLIQEQERILQETMREKQYQSQLSTLKYAEANQQVMANFLRLKN